MFDPPVPKLSLFVLYAIGGLSVLSYLITAFNMRSCLACTSVLFGSAAFAQLNFTSQSLNKTDHNLIQQAPGGPVLYYNGSGDVPSYYLTSPVPPPITPISR